MLVNFVEADGGIKAFHKELRTSLDKGVQHGELVIASMKEPGLVNYEVGPAGDVLYKLMTPQYNTNGSGFAQSFNTFGIYVFAPIVSQALMLKFTADRREEINAIFYQVRPSGTEQKPQVRVMFTTLADERAYRLDMEKILEEDNQNPIHSLVRIPDKELVQMHTEFVAHIFAVSQYLNNASAHARDLIRKAINYPKELK